MEGRCEKENVSGEVQNPCWLKSSVTFPQLVRDRAMVAFLSLSPGCFLRSPRYKFLLLKGGKKFYKLQYQCPKERCLNTVACIKSA